jgi:23S rRNA (adenine2503-C2)-methyltransferase
LECLSLGDYGKAVNIKCDALGLTRTPDPVRHTELLPLTEKWVITISTQYGCSMGCSFCDVPKVGPGRNCTIADLLSQVFTAMDLHPEITKGKRLNLHYARMGEPAWNHNVLVATALLHNMFDQDFGFHPVVSTIVPRHNSNVVQFLRSWMELKNGLLEGEAGLQLSINSTDELERMYMFNGNAMTLHDISRVFKDPMFHPRGRKITLNFAVAGYQIDPDILLGCFSPEHFIVKLTPMHKTTACVSTDTLTTGDYTTYQPYEEIESRLVKAGYDVLVFIASKEEDESRITCGNAILSDKNWELL